MNNLVAIENPNQNNNAIVPRLQNSNRAQASRPRRRRTVVKPTFTHTNILELINPVHSYRYVSRGCVEQQKKRQALDRLQANLSKQQLE